MRRIYVLVDVSEKNGLKKQAPLEWGACFAAITEIVSGIMSIFLL